MARDSEPPDDEVRTKKNAYRHPDGVVVLRNRPTLIFMTGLRMGEAFRLPRGATVVGRGKHCEIRIDDASVSRAHVRVSVDRGRVTVDDLGSSNGTLVNGVPVMHATLEDNDKIQLAEGIILKFALTDPLDESLHTHLYNAAMRDPLTRTFNRGYLMEALEKALAYARRHNVALALLMLDIDHFKKVNDTHGHLAGDATIQLVARVLQAALRAEDALARYGGEEFCILCPGTPLSGAMILGERLRQRIEIQRVSLENGTKLQVTVSIGVAAFPEVRAITGTGLIAAADTALLRAKQQGRNRVVGESEDDPPDSTNMPTQRRLPAATRLPGGRGGDGEEP